MNNIGRRITDYYCQGYFGREYDLAGAIIVAEGEEYLVIQKENGLIEFCNFQNWEWNRHADGTLSGGINQLTCLTATERQNLINSWCGY